MMPKTGGVGRCRAVALVLTLLPAILVAAEVPDAAVAKLQDGTDATSIACALTAEVSEDTVGTPVAPPAASPAAEASPVAGVPADTATAAAIESLVRTLAACLTDGQSDTVVQLVTERYLGQVYGGGERLSRADYLALAPDLPVVPVTASAVTDVRRESALRANADVITVVGNQLVHSRWTFVRTPTAGGGSRWQVDAVTPLPVAAPADANRVDVGLSDDKFKLSPGTVAGPDVVLAGTNTGKADHEMLVVHLAQGVSTNVLLREPGPGLPDGVTFVGQMTVPPGGQADLVLVGMAPGSYAIVCLLPTEDGTPHLALGMKARLRISAPTSG